MADEFDVQDEPLEGNALDRLKKLAQEAVDTEKLIAELEDNLSSCKARLLKLKTQELPDVIAEVGLPDFTTDEGWRLMADSFVSGSLPKDGPARESAIQWFEDNGHEDLIKTTLLLSFGKKQHNEALALADDLHQKGYDAEMNSGIHPQTLLAFAREALREGDKIPLERLGLFAGRTVKITPPGADKPTKSRRNRK